MNRILVSLILVTGLLFSATSFARQLPTAYPHNADREMLQMGNSIFAVILASGESFEIEGTGINRVAIDETRHLGASSTEDGKRLVFTAGVVGKAVAWIHTSAGEMTTFVVTVK